MKNKKTNSKKKKERRHPDTLFESISSLIREVENLRYDDLKQEGDSALFQKLQELQQKLSSLLNGQSTGLAFQTKTARSETMQIQREDERRKEIIASNFLSLNSSYRDRSYLPEQKLVQYLGEEISEEGNAKQFKFRDGNSGISFTLDANSVLSRMEIAV